MSAGIASPRSSLGGSIGINPNSHVFSTCFSAGASRGSIQNKAAARESNLHIREKRNMIPSHLLQFLGHRRRLVQFPQRLAPRRDEPVIERRGIRPRPVRALRGGPVTSRDVCLSLLRV